MRAALHTGTFHLDLIDRPTPVPGEGEALIRVKACGFCGSDKHDLASPPMSPNIPGHEFTGVIEKLGAGNPGNFQEGDRVLIAPKITCGECPACLAGESHYCEKVRVYGCRGGHQPPGGFAEFAAVRLGNLIRLPDTVSFEDAALADPIAVSLHALELAPRVKDANVAIFGAGSIGLVAAQIARNQGAQSVFLIDLSERHLEIARELGDFETVPAQPDASHLETLREAEIDLSLELAGGEAPTLDHAIEVTRRGGTTLLISQRPGGSRVDYQHLIFWEQRLQGVFGYRDEDFPEAVRLLEKGAISVSPLITGRYDLDSIGEALQAALHPDSVKVEVVS